jgi:hypothetical protein
MITENYVSFETAKLLKEKGFNLWCFKCYGVAVLHNGADISFDEECDLKDYGREDEIEYVEGDRLYDYGCNNSNKDAKVWAAPTLQRAIKWLEEVHHILVVADYIYECTSTSWVYKIYRLGENGKPERVEITGVRYGIDGEPYVETVGYRDYELSSNDYATREEAEDEGIRYVLKKYV